MPRAHSAQREGHADHKRAVTFNDRSVDSHGKSAMLRSSSARETRQKPRVETSASSHKASPQRSRSTLPLREQRDVSFGPSDGHAVAGSRQMRDYSPVQREETPKNRNSVKT
eukprot:symbB.v1.2.006399.t1/scaffold358.1/size381540/22